MPTFGSYSPWQDASQNAFQPAGHALSQLALEIAKARYNRNNRAAIMGLQLEKLQQQEMLNQAHETNYKAESDLNQAKTDQQRAVTKAAEDFGTANWRIEMDKGLEDPQNIPQHINLAQLHDAMARSAALSGNPQRAFPVHNIGANQVAMDPVTGQQVGQGPTVLAPGSSYQLGQSPAVVNPRPYFAPAGATPMNPQGQPEGPQTGFRPVSPGSKSSAVDAELARGLVDGSIDEKSPLYAAAMQAATNRQASATSPQPAGPPQPPASHTPEEQKLMQDANDAISKGADPEKVKARLKQMGYNPQ